MKKQDRPGCPLCVVLTITAFAYIASGYGYEQRKKYDLVLTQGTNAGHQWVEETLKGLSLEEKVGQMLQIPYYADYKSFNSGDYQFLHNQIQKYGVGSLALSLHFANSGPIKSPPIDSANVANRLQSDSKLPLLLAADLERGVASRLKDVPAFPWPMAWGAVGDPSTVERFGAITAREARAVGIQWAVAPVVDVNSNPANPVISNRSFGEDPQQVSTLVAAYVHGAHENGLLVTAKHFPGHGESSIDSHRSIPSIDGDAAHLEKFELPPFRSAIQAGADSIMPAHARVPAIDPDPNEIATTSSKIIKGFLKEQLGFKGVVLTDALEMKGVTNLYDTKKGRPTAQAAVDAVKAGCDVIMISSDLDAVFRALTDAVRSGEIPEGRIDESVRKILEMKVAVGLDKNRLVPLDQVTGLVSNREDMAFAQEVSDQAATLVRNNGKVLPLLDQESKTARAENHSSSGNALAVVLLAEAFDETGGRDFESEIRARRPDAAIFHFDGRLSGPMFPEVLKTVSDASQVVLATYVSHEAARKVIINGKQANYFGLLGPSGDLFLRIVTKYPQKTVVISLGSPYLIESFPQIQTYICTYAMASTSEVSAVKALFGEIQNHAKLPVTLPGIAPRGFSLPWPPQPRNPEQAQESH